MSDLKKKIDKIEHAIQIETAYIKEQNAQLGKQLGHSKMFAFTIMGGLTFGYLFARKKTLKQLVIKISSFTLTARRLYHNFKPFLPFF